MQSEPSIPEPARQASAGRWPRYSLRWLLAATAFLAVFGSHLNTSLNLRRAQQAIAEQQAELKRLRSELGIFAISDPAKAHVLFVSQPEDKLWRWRVYLPPQRRYLMKWATDDVAGQGLATQWEGQDFQAFAHDDPTFTVDVFLRKGSDGKWRWFLRHPWGELTREVPADHPLVTPMQPIVIRGDPRNNARELELSDPRQPVVLFRYQLIPQAEYDAAQAKGEQPTGPYPGIMVWIEPGP